MRHNAKLLNTMRRALTQMDHRIGRSSRVIKLDLYLLDSRTRGKVNYRQLAHTRAGVKKNKNGIYKRYHASTSAEYYGRGLKFINFYFRHRYKRSHV